MPAPNPPGPRDNPPPAAPRWPCVRDLARRHRFGTAVLRRFGVDPAPETPTPLDVACRGSRVRPDDVLDAFLLEAEVCRDGPWAERPLEALARHLVTEVRDPLEGHLQRLEVAARQLCRGHGCDDHGRMLGVKRAVHLLATETRQHLERERRVLYPLVAARPAFVPRAPLEVLRNEHRLLVELVDHVRDLAEGYVAPPDAAAAWADLTEGLAGCRHIIHRHARLEDEVLFPRMLRGAWG